MASHNAVQLIGRATADPELRYTSNGKAVASLRLAVDRPMRAGAEKQTDFFRCTLWEKSAELCQKFVNKGRLLFVDGRMQNREYEANDGTKKQVTEVVVNNFQLLDSKPGDNQEKPQRPASEPDPDDFGEDGVAFG